MVGRPGRIKSKGREASTSQDGETPRGAPARLGKRLQGRPRKSIDDSVSYNVGCSLYRFRNFFLRNLARLRACLWRILYRNLTLRTYYIAIITSDSTNFSPGDRARVRPSHRRIRPRSIGATLEANRSSSIASAVPILMKQSTLLWLSQVL